MTPHLRYLRYVLTHKLYVFVAGLAIGRARGYFWFEWPHWILRLVLHDLSKFRPSEWRPYVAMFYGPSVETTPGKADARKAMRDTRFNRAWLLHIHRNDHHWQHWLLREDSGKQLVLLMDRQTADEMLADWLGAGTKVLQHPAFATCVFETITWYAKNAGIIQLRQITRQHVEQTLVALAEQTGVLDAANQIALAQAARDSIEIPGREVSRR